MGAWGFASQTGGAGGCVLASWLFLRLLGLIYLAAFVSLASQIRGLVGGDGILPAAEFLAQHRHWGPNRFWRVPTLCWLNCSDGFLLWQAWGGAALACLLIVGLAPVPVLVVLWALYLSLFTVGRIFLGYQWDVLLLEAGFLAIFLAPLEIVPHFPSVTEPPLLVVWLFWWLLFRLMFSSGAVKLRSGDPTWRNFTALCRHYETQPLPTPLAWYAHQLPAAIQKVSVAVMFVIELFVPFLIFAPVPARGLVAVVFMVFMLLIQATGNYCFFNLLGIAVSVLLLGDDVLLAAFRLLWPNLALPASAVVAPDWWNWLIVAVAILIAVLSLAPVVRLFRLEVRWPGWLARWFDVFDPFRLVNSYGLFALMTTERAEIIIEGSQDGVNWRAYEFKWKPGSVGRAPRFVAPHQPRLDWQMWFAALGYYPNHPWFSRLLVRLLEGSAPVLALLKENPFPKAPPRYVRGLLFEYRFTNRLQRRATGAWWQREQRGNYCPTLELGRSADG